MPLNPTYEQLARLRTLVGKANAGRRVRTFELEKALDVAREALGSKLGYAWQHAGEHVDARSSTTLCFAVHSTLGVTIGLAGTSALDPDPGKGWAELRPWSQRVPAQNVPRSEAWGERQRDDRLSLTVDEVRAARPTSDGAALLDAVLAAPDDDAPRLVYADWLTEQGDPRGELIAIQCARAALAPADRTQRQLEEREWTLLSLHEDAWRTALGPDLLAVKFRRGFVDEVTLTADTFVERGDALIAREPVRTAHFVNAGPEGAARLAACRALRTLTGLRFSTTNRGPLIAAEGLDALLASRNLGGLGSLALEAQQIEDLGGMTLARHGPGALPSLEALAVTHDFCSEIAVRELVGTHWFRRLKKVSFLGCEIGDAGVEALAFAPGPGGWEELDLDRAMVGDRGARAIATHERLGALKRLSLRGNQIGTAGAQVLLDSPRLEGLEGLRLSDNRIGKLLSEKVKQRFGRW